MTRRWIPVGALAAGLGFAGCGATVDLGAASGTSSGSAGSSSTGGSGAGGTSVTSSSAASTAASTGSGGGVPYPPPMSAWKTVGKGDGSAFGIAVDSMDRVYVAGWFDNTLDPGVDPVVSSGPHLFVLALEADGSPRWMRSFQPGQGWFVGGLAVGPDGAVVVAASVKGAFDLGLGALDAGGGGTLAMRLGADGALLGAVMLSPGLGQTPRTVAIAPSGDVTIAGQGFVATLGPELDTKVALPVGSDVWGAAIDASGQVLITGSNAATELFAARLDAGDATAQKATFSAPALGSCGGTGVTAGPSGVLVFGSGNCAAKLGALPPNQYQGAFVVTIDAAWNASESLVPLDLGDNMFFGSGPIAARAGVVVAAGVVEQYDTPNTFVTRLAGSTPVWVELYHALGSPVLALDSSGAALVSGTITGGPLVIEKLQ